MTDATQPDAALLEQAREMQLAKNDKGERLYVVDPKHRQATEQLRIQAYAGATPQKTNDAPGPVRSNQPAGLSTKAQQQDQWLREFAGRIDPKTGRRYGENPVVAQKIENARRELYTGGDISELIANTEHDTAEGNWISGTVDVDGYKVTAPEGYQLDVAMLRSYAKIARDNGVSPEAFQKLVDEYVRNSGE